MGGELRVADFEVLIKGGMVFDGRRNPRFLADVGVDDGVIAKIGRLKNFTADRVIDASGQHVAPGFIDLHTHYDSQLFWDPICSPSGWHGVTSVMIGNCGFGFAPVRPEMRERTMLSMTRNEAVPLRCMQEGMPWDWVTMPEFLASVERTPKSVNVLALQAITPLMLWTMGLERAKAGELPTDEEHVEMARLLHEAMDAGACGVSAQRGGRVSPQPDYDGTPMITDMMHDETMEALAQVMGERNEGIIQYDYRDRTKMREDPNFLFTHVRPHIERVASMSGQPVIVLGNMDTDWHDDAQTRGLRIFGQHLTTTIEENPIIANIAEGPSAFDPAWTEFTVGTVEEIKARMADPVLRARMREQGRAIEVHFSKYETWAMMHSDDPKYAEFDEHPLGYIAEKLGMDVFDAFCEINIANDLTTKWHMRSGGTAERGGFGGLAAHRMIADHPYSLPGISDGGAHTKYFTVGSYGVLYLMTYARKYNLVSLEDAHYRLSALSGFAAGFKDRGTLVEGAPADIIVYDYENLGITEPETAYDYPAGEWRLINRPIGMNYIMCNGVVTMDRGTPTGAHPGHLLRWGKAPVGV